MAEDLIIILPISAWLYMLCFIVCILSDMPEPTEKTQIKRGVSSGSTLFATHPAILDTTVGSKLDLIKF